MKINSTARILFLILSLSFIYESSKGQVLIPSDFTLFTGPNGIGTTLIGSSIPLMVVGLAQEN
jgi:hypothetical protein